jgi:general secretion pathway protein N
MTLTRQNLVLGLSGLCALLAATLLYLIVAPLPDLEIPQVPLEQQRAAQRQTMPIATPPPQAFADINARPMFSPDRKAIAEPGASNSSGNPPSIAFVGVIMDPRDRMALIRTSASPLAGAFRLGADISGWRLTEIAADHIVLSQGGSQDTIRLEDNHAPKPATPAPPPMTAQ